MDQSFPEYPLALAARMVSRFDLPPPVEAHDFAEKGNINQHTFLVHAGRPGDAAFLLQRINHQVFVQPRKVMAAMGACLAAQREAIASSRVAAAGWSVVELVPTRSGEPFLEQVDRRGRTVWRVMVKIPAALTYKSLGEIADQAQRLAVAEEAGRGLALFGDLTATVDTASLSNPLPGYRETQVYFNQLRAVLAGHRTLEAAAELLPADPVVRESTQEHFRIHLSEGEYRRRMEGARARWAVDLACANEDFGLTLARSMASGAVRTVAVHGDTKLDNFLFDAATGRVKALVDLDTIMPHTWLSDWGDMVRSLSNVAGEKERDPARVTVDEGIYRALAAGFLRTARAVTDAEVELMPAAVRILALELGVRFLADYLRGDSYFRLGPADPPDLNLVRALVQLTLFERLGEFDATARRTVRELRCAN